MEKIYVLCIKCIYDGEREDIGYFTSLEAMRPFIIKAAEKLWASEPEENFEPYCSIDWLPKRKEEKCCNDCSACRYYYDEKHHLEQLKEEKESLLHPIENVCVFEAPLNGAPDEDNDYYQLRPLKKGRPLISELYGEEIYTFTLPKHLQDV